MEAVNHKCTSCLIEPCDCGYDEENCAECSLCLAEYDEEYDEDYDLDEDDEDEELD